MRPLQAWRYVGVYGPELMLCVAAVRIGPLRQAFWAVWDRAGGQLYERTSLRRDLVELKTGRVRVGDPLVSVDLLLDEAPGVETVSPAGRHYAWTRKQGGINATGFVEIAGARRKLAARAVVDDTAAYYPRHTSWRWSAGIGAAVDGRPVAWSLVSGINDPPRNSERTVWLDGEPMEVGPCSFADDLSSVDGLRFESEAERERNENFVIVRSNYRQPFGTFTGELPGGFELADGYGIMECHNVLW